MFKFIIKGLVIVMAVTATCGYIFYLNPVLGINQNHYMAAMIDKHKRLDSLPSPRLIFVGGSNLAFGMNCKLVEDSLKIPTVNMGLHAGLGLPFILNEMRPEIKKDDIVILSIEYFSSLSGNAQVLRTAVEAYPRSAQFIQRPLIKKFIHDIFHLGDLLAYTKRIQFTVISGIPKESKYPSKNSNIGYRRNFFSPYGDVIGELNNELPVALKDQGLSNRDYSEGIEVMNDFATYVRSLGASIYFVFPNYPESVFLKNKKPIDSFVGQIRNGLKIEIINNPEDFVLPDKYFLDTVYHLTGDGREQRTLRMIAILKNILFK